MQRSTKRSIFSTLKLAKVASAQVHPTPTQPNSPKQATGSNLNKALDRKLFRHQQYLKVLERFLNERCEFSQSALLDYDVVREAWYSFIRDNHDEFNQLDCNMRFAPQDVALLDDRYEYKRVYFCRECKRRHYHKCCDGYKVGHRFTRYGMVGLSIKPTLNIEANE